MRGLNRAPYGRQSDAESPVRPQWFKIACVLLAIGYLIFCGPLLFLMQIFELSPQFKAFSAGFIVAVALIWLRWSRQKFKFGSDPRFRTVAVFQLFHWILLPPMAGMWLWLAIAFVPAWAFTRVVGAGFSEQHRMQWEPFAGSSRRYPDLRPLTCVHEFVAVDDSGRRIKSVCVRDPFPPKWSGKVTVIVSGKRSWFGDAITAAEALPP